MLSRRHMISLVSMPLMLSACGNPSVTRRFRVVATAEVDGKRVEGSTVMQITYTRVTNSLIGAGGSTDLRARR